MQALHRVLAFERQRVGAPATSYLNSYYHRVWCPFFFWESGKQHVFKQYSVLSGLGTPEKYPQTHPGAMPNSLKLVLEPVFGLPLGTDKTG